MIMLMKDFMNYSHKIGLVKDKEYQRYQNKMKGIYDEIERLSTIRFTPKA